MAHEIRDVPIRGSLDLAESSVLELIILESTDGDIEAALGTAKSSDDEGNTSLLSSLKQRHSLFFGRSSHHYTSSILTYS